MRPNTHFNKAQLKNKWDGIKKDWGGGKN
jgi:hypothetical protein